MGFRCRRGRIHRRRRVKQSSRTFHGLSLLSDWRPGTEGVIAEVTGSTRLAARLRELGIIPGERIRVLRAGCPLIVQVGEGRFGMRRRDAATIRVCPVDLHAPAVQPVPYPVQIV